MFILQPARLLSRHRRLAAVALFGLPLWLTLVGTGSAHPHPAQAAGGGSAAAGLGMAGSGLAGWSHPWQGWDHLLAMLAVGWLAGSGRMGPRWLLPSGFLFGMATGGWSGVVGVWIPAGELGIALSLLGLGLLLIGAERRWTLVGLLACMLFGAWHGHSHGTEAVAVGVPAAYLVGFLLASLLLHLLGGLLGWRVAVLPTASQPAALRLGGALLGICGLVLLLG
jgi:urease accessory protein